jgi:hypothetical protein
MQADHRHFFFPQLGRAVLSLDAGRNNFRPPHFSGKTLRLFDCKLYDPSSQQRTNPLHRFAAHPMQLQDF